MPFSKSEGEASKNTFLYFSAIIPAEGKLKGLIIILSLLPKYLFGKNLIKLKDSIYSKEIF